MALRIRPEGALALALLWSLAAAACSTSNSAAKADSPGGTARTSAAQTAAVDSADAASGEEAVRKMMIDQMAAQQASQQHGTPMPPPEAPDVDVKLPDPGSPAVKAFVPGFIVGGQTLDVMLSGSDFRSHDTVTGDAACHVNSFKINSSHQIQINVTADDVADGKCLLHIGNALIRSDATLSFQPNPVTADKAARQAQQQLKDRAARLKGDLGKSWAVKFPNGKSDVWTVTDVSEMGVTEMKDAAGHTMNMIVGDSGTLTLMAEDCVFEGKMEGGSVSGTSPLPTCPTGSGAWSATIQK